MSPPPDTILPSTVETLDATGSFTSSIVVAQSVITVAPSTHPLAVGKIPWLITIQNSTGGDEFLRLSITCEEMVLSKIWGLQAKFVLTVNSLREEGAPLEKTFERDFSSADREHLLSLTREEMNTLLPDGWAEQPEANYGLVMTASVTVRQTWGLRHRITFGYDFYRPTDLSSLVLLIEDKKVYVNVDYLAHYSAYFARYSRRENLKELETDKETSLPSETLSEVSCHDFIELLKIVYPTGAQVTADNVEGILPLANRFLFETVLIKCEQFLLSQDPGALNIGIYKKLQWSFSFYMSALQEQCLNQLTSSAALAQLKNDPFYASLNSEVKVVLFDRMMALVLQGQ